jgi:hypothetical protein
MSDMFGGSTPSPDWNSYLDQAQDLYDRALSGAHASPAALQQVGQLKSSMLPQAYNTGLAGSTLMNQSISRGATEAINQDVQRQVAEEMGLMGNIGQSDIAQQTAHQQQGMAPFNFMGNLLGMGVGGYFGGPMGAIVGGNTMSNLFR